MPDYEKVRPASTGHAVQLASLRGSYGSSWRRVARLPRQLLEAMHRLLSELDRRRRRDEGPHFVSRFPSCRIEHHPPSPPRIMWSTR